MHANTLAAGLLLLGFGFAPAAVSAASTTGPQPAIGAADPDIALAQMKKRGGTVGVVPDDGAGKTAPRGLIPDDGAVKTAPKAVVPDDGAGRVGVKGKDAKKRLLRKKRK